MITWIFFYRSTGISPQLHFIEKKPSLFTGKVKQGSPLKLEKEKQTLTGCWMCGVISFWMITWIQWMFFSPKSNLETSKSWRELAMVSHGCWYRTSGILCLMITQGPGDAARRARELGGIAIGLVNWKLKPAATKYISVRCRPCYSSHMCSM